MREDKVFKHNISDNLQYYRVQAHFSQEQLAEKLKISTAHVANIEGKKTSVSFALLRRIIDVFQITPNDMMLAKTPVTELSKEQQLKQTLSQKLDVLKIELFNEICKLDSNETEEVVYSTPIRPRQQKQYVANSKKKKK